MNDTELVARFWKYYAKYLRQRVMDRNVANRIFNVPKEVWVRYKEPNDNMLAMP